MSIKLRTILVSFAALTSLFSMAALANPLPPYASRFVVPESIKFECKFEGGGSGKAGSWAEICRAEGQWSKYESRDEVDRLKVLCDNGDDNQDHHPIYDDSLKIRFYPDDQILILKGIHHGEHSTPLITVYNIDSDDLCRHDHGKYRFSSQIEFTEEGYSFVIPGRCEYKCNVGAPK